jgi:RNA polymerase sigma-70 factor (ECF subfamily)
MRQAARHHRRRGRSREEHGLHPGLAGAWSEGTVSESANRRRDVKAALDRLSYDHRQVVVLREFEGMTYAEIAEAVGVPRGTVESRLYRARQELKEMLKDYLP